MVVNLQGDVAAQKRILGRADQQVTFIVLHLYPFRFQSAEIFLQPLVQRGQTGGVYLPGAKERREKPKNKTYEYDCEPFHFTSGSTTPSGMNCERSP